jgi:hypothetical protein
MPGYAEVFFLFFVFVFFVFEINYTFFQATQKDDEDSDGKRRTKEAATAANGLMLKSKHLVKQPGFFSCVKQKKNHQLNPSVFFFFFCFF